jgi:hypothetical protein
MKIWRKKLNQALGLAQKVVKTRSTSLFPTSCGSIIFSEIALIPSSYAPNFVVASTHLCISRCLRSSSAL